MCLLPPSAPARQHDAASIPLDALAAASAAAPASAAWPDGSADASAVAGTAAGANSGARLLKRHSSVAAAARKPSRSNVLRRYLTGDSAAMERDAAEDPAPPPPVRGRSSLFSMGSSAALPGAFGAGTAAAAATATAAATASAAASDNATGLTVLLELTRRRFHLLCRRLPWLRSAFVHVAGAHARAFARVAADCPPRLTRAPARPTLPFVTSRAGFRRVSMLRESPLFASMPDPALERIMPLFKLINVRARLPVRAPARSLCRLPVRAPAWPSSKAARR